MFCLVKALLDHIKMLFKGVLALLKQSYVELWSACRVDFGRLKGKALKNSEYPCKHIFLQCIWKSCKKPN